LEKLDWAQKQLAHKLNNDVYILSLQNDPTRKDIFQEKVGHHVMRVLAPLTAGGVGTMGKEKVSDKIFSQIKSFESKRIKNFGRHILLRLLCCFIPSRHMRRQIREFIINHDKVNLG